MALTLSDYFILLLLISASVPHIGVLQRKYSDMQLASSFLVKIRHGLLCGWQQDREGALKKIEAAGINLRRHRSCSEWGPANSMRGT